MGSTILRSECMTTFSVVSARAGGAPSARHQTSEAVRHAAAKRRMDVMDFLLERLPGGSDDAGGWAALSIPLPMVKRRSHGASPCQRGPMLSSQYTCAPIARPRRSTRCPRCADTIHDQLKSLRMADGVAVAYRIWKPDRARRLLALLHGVASNMTRWSEFMAHTLLGESWDLLRLDLRGHGLSLYRGRLDMGVWCDDLSAIIRAEGYSDVVIAGHCF